MPASRPRKRRRRSAPSGATSAGSCGGNGVGSSGGSGSDGGGNGGGGDAAAAPTRLAMVAKYGLLDVPPAVLAASPPLRALYNDEAAWCRYATKRENVDRCVAYYAAVDDDDGNVAATGGSRRLTRAVQSALRAHLRAAGVGAPLHDALPRSVSQTFDTEWEDADELRRMDVSTRVWSPLALPTGVSLYFAWCNRARERSAGFHLRLDCRPLLLPGVSNRLVRMLRSAFEGPPSTGYPELDAATWAAVEVSSSRGVTRAAARLVRTCLLGGEEAGEGVEPPGWPSAYALTSFVVRAAMAECRYLGDTGHVWTPSRDAEAAMRAAGVWDGAVAEAAAQGVTGGGVSRSWVDAAIRRATGATSPMDAYYEPYDAGAAKRRWGEAVLAAAGRLAGQRGGDGGPERREAAAAAGVDAASLWALAAAGRFPRLLRDGDGDG